MCAVEKFKNLIAQQAPKLASIARSCRELDPAISGAASGTNDIGSSHARQPSIMEPVVLRQGKGKIPEIKSDLGGLPGTERAQPVLAPLKEAHQLGRPKQKPPLKGKSSQSGG
jgi:hypothetical protein